MLTKFMLFIIIISTPLLSYADDGFPPAFNAHYRVYAAGIPVGKGIRQLKPLPNNQYLFETNSHTSGMAALIRDDKIVERSIFSYENGKIRPLSYTYAHTSSKRQKHVETHFDWAVNTVSGSYKQQDWQLPLLPDVLDKHVYQIAFMQALQQGDNTLTFQVADKGKIKTYQPKFLGKATLKTDLGELQTLKYQRISPTNAERRTTVWLVPSLHYLPAQVEHVEKADGETIRMVLKAVEGLN